MNPRKLGKIIFGVVAVVVMLLGASVRFDRPAAEVESRLATPPSRFVNVDGLRTHYRDRGQGPVVVLLHGSNSSLFTWEGWTTELVKNHRVVALDLPGHGLTGPDPEERYLAEEMATFVEQFVTAIGVEHFTIVGNSMGGNVAFRYALAHPTKIDHLILVDSAGLPREEPKPFGFRMYSSPIGGPIVRWCTPNFMVAKSARDAYGDPRKMSEATIAIYEDILYREGNREATRKRFSRIDPPATAEMLARLHVPTLILWGGKDRWILPKYGERLHAMIAGSRLLVFPELGHTCMEEDPATTVAAARAFLDEPAQQR